MKIKKAKGTQKKCVIKRKLFRSSSNWKYNKPFRKKNWCRWSEWRSKRIHKNNKLILKAQQRFKSETYNVFTEEIKNIA